MKSTASKASLVIVLTLSIITSSFPIAAQTKATEESRKIKELITRYNDQNRFHGVVLVAKNGEKIFSGGFGMANIEWNIPNSPDAKYMLASVSKTFTATLVMRLIDQGKLSLDTKLSDALPWYRKDVGERVNIRQLLNHTSGIPNYMDMRFHSMDELNRDFGTSVINKIAFAKKYCQDNLEFEPGTKWNYNNSAYFLLGLIVEQVTGKPFDVAMKELVFDPLKMTNSGDIQPDPEQVVQGLATGYLKSNDGFHRAHYWNLSTAFAAGSLYSTLDDLLKFDQALYTSTFLSDKSKEAMFTPAINGYGCGWELREIPLGPKSEVRKIQTHEGFLWVWHTRIFRIPEDGLFIMIISNAGDSPLEKMFTGITDIIYGREPVFPKPSLCAAVEKKYKTSDIDEAISFGRTQQATNSQAWDTPENEFNALGYRFLQSGITNDAVKVFRWNTELHPGSWNVWDSYGESLYAAGDKQAAIEAYQKSIQLNPESKSGIEMLDKLKSGK